MSRLLKNQEALEKLAILLQSGYYTASNVARRMRCAKMVAYARLRALGKQVKLKTARVREGKSGPKAVAYTIERKRKAKGGRR